MEPCVYFLLLGVLHLAAAIPALPSSATFSATTITQHPSSTAFSATTLTQLPSSSTFSATTLTIIPFGPTCVTGSPVDLGNGFTVSSFTVVTPLPVPPTIVSRNYVPEVTFASVFEIGSTELFVNIGMQSYAEFKCQFQCSSPCKSWFVAWNIAGSFWTCNQYSAIFYPFDMVPDTTNRFSKGVAFNSLCPTPSVSSTVEICTKGVPVTLGAGSVINYALVTPTTPLPPTGIGLGYTLPTVWSDAHRLSETDIILADTQREQAEYRCQFNCTAAAGCESWFVGFLIKGAAGYYWRCTQYSALITPDLLVPTNQALLRNGTGWDRIC